MSFSPKFFFFGSVGIFLLGVWGISQTRSSFIGPPKLSTSKLEIEKTDLPPPVSAETLSLPWIRPYGSFKRTMPIARAVSVDKTSLMFLGSYKDAHSQASYFFKLKSTGQILILHPGQKTKGWLLEAVGDHAFTLTGPGGRYEVLR
ncbi:MAG: hypothetical protein HKM06_02570 [Spirochaetales bacterium]|nr:hypothetical protein [Spirochaetales bacterium]